MPDHVHMLIGLRPIQCISSLIQIVKSESTKWIRQQEFCSCQFAWQEGYGAFSYSKSQVSQVILYIQQQELHHRKKTFQEEYINMLTESGIDFDKRYIFKEPIWNVSLFLVLVNWSHVVPRERLNIRPFGATNNPSLWDDVLAYPYFSKFR